MLSNTTGSVRWSVCYLSAFLTLMPIISGVAGQVSTEDELHDRFELFTNCRPMMLSIDVVGPYATKAGLSRALIQAAAESRLRSARLYEELADGGNLVPLLRIVVGADNYSYSVRLGYYKWVYDPLSGLNFWASVRIDSSFGTYDGTSGTIMSYLSGHLDKFLADYLRVNETACETR